MKSDLGTAGAAIGMIVLSLLFGGVVLAVYPGWETIGCWFSAEDGPAWVQAVGSIAAVVCAFIVGNRQATAVRRDAFAQFRRKMVAMGALFTRANDFVDEVVQFCANAGNAQWYASDGYEPEDASELLRRFDAFDIATLESRDGAEAFFELRRSVRRAKAVAESISAHPNLDDDGLDWGELNETLYSISMSASDATQRLGAALQQAGTFHT